MDQRVAYSLFMDESRLTMLIQPMQKAAWLISPL